MQLPPILYWLVFINLVTLVVYGYDKFQATREGWRISEHALLLLALIGGSIGAFVAMQIFRHKTRKSSFQFRFWGIVALQLLIVVLYIVLIR